MEQVVRMHRIFHAIFFVMLAIVSLTANGQVKRERNSSFVVSVGESLPSFSYITLDGDTMDTDFMRGQVSLIQFGASWCPFSQAQLVELDRKVWRKYKDNGSFFMIGICEDLVDGRKEFLRQREEREIGIPFAFDENERMYRLFVTPNGSVTRTVIVNPASQIVELHDIHTRRDFRQIRRTVRRLLRKQ